MSKERLTEYLVQPQMYAERKGDSKKGDIINKKWKPISEVEANKICPGGTCGNVGHNLMVDVKTKKIKIKKDWTTGNLKEVALYEAISAALALYRAICIIEHPIVETDGANGYKVPWTIKLKHVETGQILGISEWKGGFGIWTKFHKVEELPESYKKDMVELLNLMLSDRSPHPYDGCTAGQVA